MKNDVKPVATLFRERAEQLLKSTSQSGTSHPSVENILKILHEWEEYSAELEIQNEELLIAGACARKAPQKDPSPERVKPQNIPEHPDHWIGSEMQKAELLRVITDNSPDTIIQLDRNGTILSMNHPFSGYAPEDTIGSSFYDWALPEYQILMKQSLELAVGESTTQVYQSGGSDARGEIRWYRTSLSPVNEGVVVNTVIMIVRDITESIRSREILREDEEKRNAIITTTRDGFWIADRNGCLQEVNDTYCRMSGYTREELLTMRIQDIEAIESPDDTVSHIKKIIEFREDRFESRHRRKDGSVMDIETSVQYSQVNGGQFISFLHDITSLKRSEKSLRQSNERYKSLFQDNHSVMMLLNPDTGDIIDANPVACSYYGWSHSELCRKTIFEIDPFPKEVTFAKLQQSKHEENNHLFLQHRLANGELRDIEVYSGPIQFDESTMLYTIIHDITESKQAQEALRINEERYSLIYNSSRDGVFSMDMSGHLIGANRSFCEEINLQLANIIGHTFAEFGLPEYLCAELNNLKRRVQESNNSIISELKVSLSNEKIRYYELVLNPLHDSNRCIVGFGGSIRNITKRKKSNQALIDSEKRFRYLIKNIQVGVILYGPNAEVIMRNPKTYELLGIPENQFEADAGMNADYDAIHEDGTSFPGSERPVAVTFATGQSVRDIVMGIYRPATTDFIWVLIDTEIILNDDGTIRNVICSFIDITKLKKTENELRQNELRLKYHLENSPLAVIERDRDFIVTQWSVEAERIFGWKKEDAIGKHIDTLNLINEEDVPDVNRAMEKLTSGNKDTIVNTSRNITESGNLIVCTWYNSILFDRNGQITSVMSLVQDITLKKQAEDTLKQLNEELEERVKERTAELSKSNEALKITQEKYRTVAYFATYWEFWIDQTDHMIYCSPSCEQITGYKPKEFDQDSKLITKIIYPDDLQLFQKHQNKELQAQPSIHEIQYRIIRKDGTIRWIGHFCQPVFDENGHFKGTRGSNKDITARKKMEELLTTSNQKYKLLSENISDGIFICKNGRFEYINNAICDIFGYNRREFERMKLTQLVTTDHYEELENFLYKKSFVNQGSTLEVECLKKDFSLLFVEMRLNYVAKDQIVYGVVHDITEKKSLQKKIVKAIIHTEEKERANFSKELHDGLGPLLSTIKLYLQWSERPNSNSSRVEIIGKAGEILEEALATVKEISNKLSPHLLMNYGLNSAIKSFVEKLNATATFNIVYESNTKRRIGAEIEATIYRAVIECINNSMKYARANNIYINLTDSGNQIQLRYKDDGLGFDIAEALSKHKGLGLFNLQNRLHTIGGKVTLSSEQGKGVDYLFTVNV
jgi:PAS domain S-box-containing protein